MKTIDTIEAISISLVMACIITTIHQRIDHTAPIQAPQTPPETLSTPEREIMSIRELQTFLNEKGHSRYKCEIDGKMGPETQRAWDNYICDRYAKGEFE